MSAHDVRLWLMVDLMVKFRFLGVTLGSLTRAWRFEMPEAVLLLQQEQLLWFDDRGVRLRLSLARAEA